MDTFVEEDIFPDPSISTATPLVHKRAPSRQEDAASALQKRTKQPRPEEVEQHPTFLYDLNQIAWRHKPAHLVYWQPYDLVIPLESFPAWQEVPHHLLTLLSEINSAAAKRRFEQLQLENLHYGHQHFDNALLGEAGQVGVFCLLPSGEKFSTVLMLQNKDFSCKYNFPDASHLLTMPLLHILTIQFLEAYTLKPGGRPMVTDNLVFWNETFSEN